VDRLSCEQFAEHVHALVRLELLDTDLREQAFAHARICGNCSLQLVEAQALAEASDVVRESANKLETPLFVEAGLLLAFRDQHAKSRAHKRTTNFIAVAAAACLLVAGLFGYAQWSRIASQKNQTTNSARGTQTTPNSLAASQFAAGTGVMLPEAKNDSANDADQLANFIPVPFADEATADDPGVIVRVQLTRAALGKLGYQVEQGKGKELVQADVLVGEDGWPRAVRLER
jgi:hypothetical protein